MSNAHLELIRYRFHEPEIQRWLLEQGTRQQIIVWLIWNDPNGIYTDRDSEAEGYPSLTIATARAAMRRALDTK